MSAIKIVLIFVAVELKPCKELHQLVWMYIYQTDIEEVIERWAAYGPKPEPCWNEGDAQRLVKVLQRKGWEVTITAPANKEKMSKVKLSKEDREVSLEASTWTVALCRIIAYFAVKEENGGEGIHS